MRKDLERTLGAVPRPTKSFAKRYHLYLCIQTVLMQKCRNLILKSAGYVYLEKGGNLVLMLDLLFPKCSQQCIQ